MVQIPINEHDLRVLETLLASADVFTTPFQHVGPAVFRAEIYIRESVVHRTKCVFVVDRNIFTRLLSLGRGGSATSAHRAAAGVLAFAQTTESLIEPNMALYEWAATAGSLAALSELGEFRRLDNNHPQLFADVAVGRKDSLDCVYLCEDPVAEAFCLANRFLAPNVPKKRLLNSLRSPDRNKALEGVRNAAWDLAFVSEWWTNVRSQKEDGKLWIMATLDEDFMKWHGLLSYLRTKSNRMKLHSVASS